jgi:hypothetical protein
MPPFDNITANWPTHDLRREDYLLFLSDLTYEPESSLSFASLAKTISSLFLLGQVPLSKPLATPAAPLPTGGKNNITATICESKRQLTQHHNVEEQYSWLKSYQMID